MFTAKKSVCFYFIFIHYYVNVAAIEPKYKLEQTIEFCTDKIQTNRPNDKFIKTNINNYPNGIILSPNYPSNYSKNNECVVNLKAPKNYIIKLRFDDNFSIEPSNGCMYDYVEIRDGPHGYSPYIGRYCGKVPPPDITSSGREMWLRFNSDDSIELNGFRAYYEFKPLQQYDSNMYNRNRVLGCEIYRTNDNYQRFGVGSLTDDDVSKYYFDRLNEIRNRLVEESDMNVQFMVDESYIECTINIEVEKNERVFLVFEKLNISKAMSDGKTSAEVKQLRLNCTENFIQVYDGSTSVIDRKFHFCTSDSNKLYKSKTNKIFIRYLLHKNSISDYVKFKLSYNPFKNGPCEDSHFDCLDNTCINTTLVCNGKRNCNHSVDEAGCPHILDSKQQKKQSWTPEQKFALTHKIIISVVGTILSIVIIVSIFVSCNRSLKESKRKRKEYESLRQMKTNENNNNNNDKSNNHHSNNYIICSNASSLDSSKDLETVNPKYYCNNEASESKNRLINENILKDDEIYLDDGEEEKDQFDSNPDDYSLNLSDIDEFDNANNNDDALNKNRFRNQNKNVFIKRIKT